MAEPEPVNPASLDNLKIAAPAAPAPGRSTTEWIGIIAALATVPGVGALLVACRDILISRPWPFVALAGIAGVVALGYAGLRTLLKLRGLALGLLVLLVPSVALADIARPRPDATAIGAGLVLLLLASLVGLGAGLVRLVFWNTNRRRRRELEHAVAVLRAAGPAVVLAVLLAPSVVAASGNMPHTAADPASGLLLVGLSGALTFVLTVLAGREIERRGVPRSRARNAARWGTAALVLLASSAHAMPSLGLVLPPAPAESRVRTTLAQADEMPVTPPTAAPVPAAPTELQPPAAAPAPVVAPEKPPAAPAAEKPPAKALDPREPIASAAADCTRCVTKGIALYKQRGGPLAIAGMALGTLLDLTAHFVIPMLTAQGKPETDPMMAGATP